jgi:Flp pilus assembly protein protease CpaA
MIGVLLIVVTLFALLVASYTDIKTREVPDWLNYGLMFAAFGIRLIFSIPNGWNILISGLFGFAICWCLALLFYYSNQWGGGDSKLLMAMGAIIGITFPFDNSSWDLLLFFFSLLFLGSVYGLIWMMVVAFQRRKIFAARFRVRLAEQKTLHFILMGVSLLLLVGVFFFPLILPLTILPLVFFYLFSFVTVVEESCFLKNIDIEKLTPGDWLFEDVLCKNKILMQKKTLELEDIWNLKNAKFDGKIKKVLIKEGIPFVPGFLFAYVLLIFGRTVFEFVLGFLG